MVASYLVTHR